MNIPNVLTSLRILFAIVIFCLFPFQWYVPILVLFVLASLTDFLDGWWARRFKQITVFGRIMDPFADKLLICGVMIALLGVPAVSGDPNWFGYRPWMVIVVVARELWITSLRAVIEKDGGDFSAKWVGKWKMAFQCTTIIAFLILCAMPESSELRSMPLPAMAIRILYCTAIISLWGTVLITLWSGVSYTVRAVAVLHK